MKDGRIIFTRPAGGFFEKLPIGNGRMGAMVSGSIEREEIVLNENSMWSGYCFARLSSRADGFCGIPPMLSSGTANRGCVSSSSAYW